MHTATMPRESISIHRINDCRIVVAFAASSGRYPLWRQRSKVAYGRLKNWLSKPQSERLPVPDYVMTQAATLFLGPHAEFWGRDAEKWFIPPEPKCFQRLVDAVRYAVENLSTDEKNGARIRLENAHHMIPWSEIEALYKILNSKDTA